MKIEDIARLANVSKSAVSLALNDKPGVSEETRKIILDIAKEYNYVPLRKVNKNKKKQTKLIRFLACTSGDIVTDNYQTMPFFSQLISKLADEINHYSYSLLLSTIDKEMISKELKHLETEQASSAIILLGTNLSEDDILQIKEIQKNLVVIDTCFQKLDVDFVAINNYQGGYLAAKHLVSEGHTSIGYAMSQTRMYNFSERQKGFSDCLEDHQLYVNQDFFIEFPGMKITDQLLHETYLKNLHNLPSAIFCENDYIAISLVKTLTEIDYRIPEDISIIGFDDIPEATVISPELSTIHVPIKQIVQATLERISKMIEKKQTHSSCQLINTSLIKRNSVTAHKETE
ncbi:LacI family DNA-binding transcriptional regulator [Vagococcus elongatus]|uniref:HTH lacI-type domain-containing protein n=1 Tax=Vagococcus elongatus TaxID=180344 RepID=A0A430B456_9ENTE|nr:LacI family DNA-binding transcriptional regulator [Vagococcus elongatus]RSU15120.1 hypothetical protein CBF29_01960 [Vagococcus elongatus]